MHDDIIVNQFQYTTKDLSRRIIHLDLFHHTSKGSLQSPKLLGGVLLFDNNYFIAALLENPNCLGSRFIMHDLLHLVLFHYGRGDHLGAQWSDSRSDHALQSIGDRRLLLRR